MHPGVGVAGREHSIVRHRDGLDRRAPTRRQQGVDRLEVASPVLVADGLDHLDRHNGVVLPLYLPIVEKVDLNAICQSRSAYPLRCQFLLFDRKCHRAHRRSPLGSSDRQFSPACADFEHSRTGSDTCAIQQSIDLPMLRRCEHVPRRGRPYRQILEEGTGIRHGVVEEQFEHLVREVVVPGDVRARVLRRIPFTARLLRNVEAS